MKTLAILFTLFYFLNALAVAPYGIKGQNQSVTYPNVYQYPNYSVTGLGGINALIETGNKNILENPSFEAPFFGSAPPSWTSLGMTFNTSALPLSGQKAVRVSMSSSAMAFAQDSGVSQAAFAGGIQCLAMVYVKTTVAGIFVSSRQNSVTSTTNRVAVNNDGKYGLYKVPFICGSGSNGISIHSNGVAVTGDVDVDDSFVGAVDLKADVPLVTSQSSYLGQTANFGAVAITGALTSSVGSGIYSYNAGTGLYTVLKSAKFNISAMLRTGSAASVISVITVNSTSVSLATSLPTAFARAVSSFTGILQINDTFSISGGAAVTSDEQKISVSATEYVNTSVYSSPVTINADKIGEIIQTTNSTAPQGFISALNKSIGQTGSGATYTGQTYFALYEHLWSIAGLTTTAGDVYRISSAKGASASADFTANKTITIDYETNAPFIRGKASAASIGAYSSDTFQGHRHLIRGGGTGFTALGDNGLAAGATVISSGGALGVVLDPNTDGTNGTPRTGTETKPKNVSLNIFIRFAGDTQLITGQFNGLQTCTDTLACTDTFSAVVSAAGVVSGENANFINGNCTNPLTGQYVCTFNTSIFTVAPNCVANHQATSTYNQSAYAYSTSSTATQIASGNNALATNLAFTLICQKQGADYIGKTAMAVASDQNVRSIGSTNVDIQSVFFGSGAGCATVCSTGTCTICGQVGSKITSVTFSSAGIYLVNGIDSTKYMCSGSGHTTVASVALSHARSAGSPSIQAVIEASGANVRNATFTCIGIP